MIEHQHGLGKDGRENSEIRPFAPDVALLVLADHGGIGVASRTPHPAGSWVTSGRSDARRTRGLQAGPIGHVLPYERRPPGLLVG
ncbi:MAG: hypothetical protein M0Z93_00230 [Actinomycetota bacterium]|nr:hypothetical protein [Actinomycetota bacterium]